MGCVGDFECLLLAVAGCRGLAARSFHAVHRVDASRGHLGVVDEVEPWHGTFTRGALAGSLGRIHCAVLRHHGQRVGRELGLVEGEGGDLLREEVVAQPLVVALGLQVHVELPCAEGAERECETGDGGYLPLRKRVPVQSGSQVVELGYGLVNRRASIKVARTYQ